METWIEMATCVSMGGGHGKGVHSQPLRLYWGSRENRCGGKSRWGLPEPVDPQVKLMLEEGERACLHMQKGSPQLIS